VFVVWVVSIVVTGLVGWRRCAEHRAARSHPARP
jgi:hypothetical protein